MKVVIFCGGLRRPHGRGDAAHPEADDRDRRQADPLAHHALLRDVGVQRLHPLPRLQGRGRQASTSSRTTARCSTTSCSTASAAGTKLELLSRDLDEWRITFVDTGLNATIGERLKAVEPYLGDDETFLATYGDGLTDAPLPEVIDAFHESGKTAMFLSVRPQFNAHLVSTDAATATCSAWRT